MTIHQARKDAKDRLARHGIAYEKITAKTISFEGLGYGKAIFVEIHGANLYQFPNFIPPVTFKEGIQKPSEGGYILKFR